jgi:plastocyanin
MIRRLATLAALAAASLVLVTGCRVKDSPGDSVNGKKLFVSKCGSCHVLSRAGTRGVIGPSLDAAFRQSRIDGIPSDTIRGVVNQQIRYPQRGGAMPADLVKGDDAYDVASYVALAAAKSGKDTGPLAAIGGAVKKKKAAAKNGRLEIPADPNGQLAYLVSSATAPTGKLTLDSLNKSSTPHNIALEGSGIDEKGPVISGGKRSTISVDVKSGPYTFYCSVPGHREGGMVGKLTVK